MGNIKTWRDLVVWKSAHELVICTYKLTASFPNEEKFGLLSQMRRAGVSVASNIVEGFHRRTLKDSLSFYNVADASLEELRYQYLLARDLQYISAAHFVGACNLMDKTGKLIGAWMKSQRDNVVIKR